MQECQIQKIINPLLKWYDQNKRKLPWRMDKNPYNIWISEIMLQQTRVEAVIEYYLKFIKELPDVSALARVPDEQLLKLWEGLGYYSRARNLKKAAIQIVNHYACKIPSSYKDLLTLSGIGPYTAGAIASIAFDVPVPAIDGNVLRVTSRILASERDISKQTTIRYLYDYLSEILPKNRPGDFNQALMELGAMVCLPRANPRCSNCPISSSCQAFLEGNPKQYPVKTPKKPRKVEEKTVFIIESNGKILLHRRPEVGLLAGMWELPNIPGTLTEEHLPEALLKYGLHMQSLISRQCSKHIFTHIEWHMTGFFVKAQVSFECEKEYKWMSIHEIKKHISIPSAFGTFLEIISIVR